MHLCISCAKINAFVHWLYMHTCIFFISSQPRRPGGGGKDAAKEDKDVTQHRQGRHRSDGKDARQYRQGCRRSLVSNRFKNRQRWTGLNGSEGWQLARVCSVKHQKQLSGRQGSWSEKHRGKDRTAPVAPKVRGHHYWKARATGLFGMPTYPSICKWNKWIKLKTFMFFNLTSVSIVPIAVCISSPDLVLVIRLILQSAIYIILLPALFIKAYMQLLNRIRCI